MTQKYASEWLPGYVIIPRRGGHAWQIGIIKDARGGCLLYTSPSPRDRTRSRMPSSA